MENYKPILWINWDYKAFPDEILRGFINKFVELSSENYNTILTSNTNGIADIKVLNHLTQTREEFEEKFDEMKRILSENGSYYEQLIKNK